MKLTIVGATGGIGRHLVDLAVAAGHVVTAAVRDPAGLTVPVVRVALSRSARCRHPAGRGRRGTIPMTAR